MFTSLVIFHKIRSWLQFFKNISRIQIKASGKVRKQVKSSLNVHFKTHITHHIIALLQTLFYNTHHFKLPQII